MGFSVNLSVVRFLAEPEFRDEDNRKVCALFYFLINMIIKPTDGNRAYLKPFTFQASRYEEYVDGVCLSKGTCQTTIISKPISHDCVAFALTNEVPVKIKDRFGLPILAMQEVMYCKTEYNMED